jgi:hypothetical protein
MKWKESLLSVDLNESKLNVREDNDQHFEIVPKLFIEPDETDDDGSGGDGAEKVFIYDSCYKIFRVVI